MTDLTVKLADLATNKEPVSLSDQQMSIMSEITEALKDTLESVLFEPNNNHTRNFVQETMAVVLADMFSYGDLTGFIVRCNDTNNTQHTIRDNALIVDIDAQPKRFPNHIHMNVCLTNEGFN